MFEMPIGYPHPVLAECEPIPQEYEDHRGSRGCAHENSRVVVYGNRRIAIPERKNAHGGNGRGNQRGHSWVRVAGRCSRITHEATEPSYRAGRRRRANRSAHGLHDTGVGEIRGGSEIRTRVWHPATQWEFASVASRPSCGRLGEVRIGWITFVAPSVSLSAAYTSVCQSLGSPGRSGRTERCGGRDIRCGRGRRRAVEGRRHHRVDKTVCLLHLIAAVGHTGQLLGMLRTGSLGAPQGLGRPTMSNTVSAVRTLLMIASGLP